MVSIGEIIHGFVLFVDDSDAGFVGADGNGLDVRGGFAARRERGVDLFGGFDGGLGVEFGWERSVNEDF